MTTWLKLLIENIKYYFLGKWVLYGVTYTSDGSVEYHYLNIKTGKTKKEYGGYFN